MYSFNINYLASYPTTIENNHRWQQSHDTQHPHVILPLTIYSLSKLSSRNEVSFLRDRLSRANFYGSPRLPAGEKEKEEKLDLRAEIPIADFIKTRQRTWAVLIKQGVAYPCFSIQDRMELKRKLHCKPFSWYLKNVYPELVIPTSEGGPGGSLKQGSACLDSMGHLLDGNVGLYPCHDTGGNQVSMALCYSCYTPGIFEYTAMK